jgi:hypothetical protein
MTCVIPVADNGFAPTRPYYLSSLAYGRFDSITYTLHLALLHIPSHPRKSRDESEAPLEGR